MSANLIRIAIAAEAYVAIAATLPLFLVLDHTVTAITARASAIVYPDIVR